MDISDKRVKTALTAAIIGAIASLVLAIIKTYVGLSTNSVCIMLDGANSYMDIISGGTAALAFGFLLRANSDKAPFGYGKGEYLAGLSTTVLCLIFGGLFLLESVNRLAMAQPIWYGLQSTLLIVAAFVIKLGLAIFFYFVNKKVKLKAIAALFLDSLLDLGVTAASFISLTVSAKVSFAADAYFGIAISLVVILSSIKGIVQNTRDLLGTNPQIYAMHKKAIAQICNQYGFEAKNAILHDYGYSGIYGTVELAVLPSLDKQDNQTSLAEQNDRTSQPKTDIQEAQKQSMQKAVDELAKHNYHLQIISTNSPIEN